MKILVINCGSSSLKYQLIDMDDEKVLAKGNYERIGQKNSFVTHKVGEEKYVIENYAPNHKEAFEFMLKQLQHEEYGVIKDLNEINAIGHRVPHGTDIFNKSVLITDEVVKSIESTLDLAPIHNPSVLIGIDACKKLMKDKPMVAVFDTAFHQTIPEERFIYPIPYKYYEKYKVRKYGFHGTSHRYVSERVAELMNKKKEELKTVVCHIGQRCKFVCCKVWKKCRNIYGYDSSCRNTNVCKKWRFRSINCYISNEKGRLNT